MNEMIAMSAAERGQVVRVHYTGTLADGSIFDSSGGGEPLEFTLGAGQVIAGFDAAVTGMLIGEEKRVTIPAEEAYGPHRTELLLVIDRDQLPDEVAVQIGESLQMSDGRQAFPVTIREVGREQVVLDANHPLAGKDLTFDLMLVEIVG
jgi:peptidylprolyl isomerase